MAAKFLCPICKKPVASPSETNFPFCSERCRMIDLGHWLEGGYQIPGDDVAPPDSDNHVN
jgi:hypothetical protein